MFDVLRRDGGGVGSSVVCIRMEAFLSIPGGKRGVLSMQSGRGRVARGYRLRQRD